MTLLGRAAGLLISGDPAAALLSVGGADFRGRLSPGFALLIGFEAGVTIEARPGLTPRTGPDMPLPKKSFKQVLQT